MDMNAPVTYDPRFFQLKEAADAAFQRLWNELVWVRHDKVPRREYYVALDGQDYSYGRAEFARTYESQFLHPAIYDIWMLLQLRTGTAFDVCFLNGYEDGRDQLGWHADDSPEMDDARPIAIVTLGQERDILFRETPRPRIDLGQGSSMAVKGGDPERLRLQHGWLCLMAPGMQDTHQHRIPKAGFQPCGPRISLTFRGYQEPTQ